VISSETFDVTRHRIAGVESYRTSVDGKRVIGTDGNLPTMAIASVELFLDGRRIPVPTSLYDDLFQPDLDARHVSIRFGRTFAGVVVQMLGGDGAGGYVVTWALHANGKHRRFIISRGI